MSENQQDVIESLRQQLTDLLEANRIMCEDFAAENSKCAELEQQLATAQAALQAVSDDWDGEHFHNGGSSFMPKVNAALGRGEL